MKVSKPFVFVLSIVLTFPIIADDRWKDLPSLPDLIEKLGIKDNLGPFGQCGSRSFATEEILMRDSQDDINGLISCFDGAIKKLRRDYRFAFNGQIYEDDFTSCFDLENQREKVLCYLSRLRRLVEVWEKRLGEYEASFGKWQVESVVNRKTDVTTLQALLKSTSVDGEYVTLRVQCVMRFPSDKIRAYLKLPRRHEPFLDKISDHSGIVDEKRVFSLQGKFHGSTTRSYTWYELEGKGTELFTRTSDVFFRNLLAGELFQLTVDGTTYEFDPSKAEGVFLSMKGKCIELPYPIGFGGLSPHARSKLIKISD